MIKRLLCYGDSNTWGLAPGRGGRFDETTRWPGVLACELGEGYTVIEEGLSGRTTVFDDPTFEFRNGKTYLTPCLQSHCPLDLVMLMLGTNDLKHMFGLSAFDIARGVEVLGDLILKSGTGRGGGPPKLLLLCPPPLNSAGLDEHFTGGLEKSQALASYYKAVADTLGCAFFDVGTALCSSPIDGVHWEVAEHRKLGRELGALVPALVGDA